MKKIFHSLLAVSVFFCGGLTTLAQQQNVSGLVFTTSSTEAVSSFREALKFSDLGEGKKARVLFQKSIEQDPKMVIGHLYRANYSISPQEFAMHLSKAKENLSSASDWEKLYFDYTETFLKDDLDRRLLTAQKMIAMFPGVARAYIHLGDAYSARNDFMQARQQYQKAISLEPSWPGGYNALTNSYLFEEPKDFKKAEKNATKLTTLASNSAGSFILLGDAYRAQNDLRKAHDAYAKAIQLDSESPVAFYKRGHALTYLGEYDKARADYQRAGNLDQSPTFAVQTIAYTYLYQDDPKKALEVVMDEANKLEGSEKSGTVTAARYQLLNTAALIAFHTKDEPTLKKLIASLQPLSDEMGKSLGTEEGILNQQSNMLYWNGLLLAMNKDYSGAKAKAEEIKKVVEPINNLRKLEGYHSLLGYAAYQQNEFKKAVEHFEQSDKLNVYDQFWLAKAYEAAGKKDKASAIYKSLANYNFNNAGYAVIRNEVRKKG